MSIRSLTYSSIVVIVRLTDTILLASPRVGADEANDTCDYGEGSHGNGQNECSGCLKDPIYQEDSRKRVDD